MPTHSLQRGWFAQCSVGIGRLQEGQMEAAERPAESGHENQPLDGPGSGHGTGHQEHSVPGDGPGGRWQV